MLSFFIPYGLLTILIIFILINFVDLKSLVYIIFFILIFELLLSFTTYNYISILGFLYFCNIGTILYTPLNYNIQLVFIFDSISFFFHTILFTALIVCFIFLIQYFEYDINSTTIILLSSIFSQLAFIYFLTYDLFLILFFWEWISIVSFFLIQFWSFRVTTNKAALKVFCISQIGDFFFFISIFLLFIIVEDTDVSNIITNYWLYKYFYYFNIFYVNLIYIISISLSMSLFLKSAQFIFFPWLLDAMEAPVPISAQLHSSTLVIIGFYVFFRFYEIILFNNFIMNIYFIFSFFTIISATFLGFYQDDGKRMLACSTASQLGYVILALSLNLQNEALFLLIFVCCNKAFIFSWFGFIMDKSGGLSDFRLLKNFNLFFFEKSGLIFFCFNSTIAIGSLNWHIKSLLYSGLLDNDFFYYFVGLEVLNLTWFLSSVYLLKLFFSLFSLPTRSIFTNKFKNKRTFNFYVKYIFFNRNFLFWLVNFIFTLILSPIILFSSINFLSL